MQRQKGFTLIELIVVIVILGILAATALPRFANLASDARVATLNGARGALQATSAMSHGSFLVAATPPASVTYEGITITMNTTSGYPSVAAAADGTALAAAAGLTNDYTIIPPGSAATATAPGTAANQIAIVPNSVAGTATAVTCNFTYTGATAANTTPTYSVMPTAASC